MKKGRKLLVLIVLLVLAAGLGIAQRTAREIPSHSTGTPNWTNDAAFQKDVFTFVRIKYSVNGTHGFGHTPDRWLIDEPPVGRVTKTVRAVDAVFDAHESEHVLLEGGIIGPVGRAGAVRRDFARGALRDAQPRRQD